MRVSPSTCLVLSTLALGAWAAPESSKANARQVSSNTNPASIPQNDPDPKKRAIAVAVRNKGFIYGPSLIGEAAFFPNGTLGNARSAADMDLWGVDRKAIDERVAADVEAIQVAIGAVSIHILFCPLLTIQNPLLTLYYSHRTAG